MRVSSVEKDRKEQDTRLETVAAATAVRCNGRCRPTYSIYRYFFPR